MGYGWPREHYEVREIDLGLGLGEGEGKNVAK